jgi:hypothetical protein
VHHANLDAWAFNLFALPNLVSHRYASNAQFGPMRLEG